jgi:hypothetical protein
MMSLFLTIACLFFTLTSSALPREVVNFDFAWKFTLNDESPTLQCPASVFPRDLSKVECMGLKKDSSTNADDCRGACCADITCAIWQFASDDGCWIGNSDDCDHNNPKWAGGGRDVPGKMPPPATGGPTSRDYDDSHWELVDLPHDGLIAGVYYEGGPRGQAYLPKNTTWYRKHFNIPADWKNTSIWIYFEGIFRASEVFLNGEMLSYHDSGYTSFAVRLDNATDVYYGDGSDNENVVAVRATSNGGTGWWYEGGGIYRHTYLTSAPHSHIVPDGYYGNTTITGDIHYHDPSDITKGMYADTALLQVTAEVVNEHDREDKQYIQCALYDEDGKNVGSCPSIVNTMEPHQTLKMYTDTKLSQVEVWTPARPYLYTLSIQLFIGIIADSVNVSIGFRSTRWDPDEGFFLNGIHFTWRGFNNHNNFAGVGMAVPDRINLFRGQSMRAVGANSWRMSHNPPIPKMLDILDNLGIIVWNENRVFGNSSIWVENQRDMVRRDRNHPSIMAWSFCNEGGCNRGDTEGAIGKEFRDVSYAEDANRPVTANMNGHIGDGLTSVIDVQGFSHQGGNVFDNFHSQFPKKPTIGSECCSCVTQRGEDFSDKNNRILGNFNAPCLSSQVENQLNRKYVAGCMVWTLFDYYGEPSFGGWPHVSSSFGAIDLAGFAKEGAYWYRSWWLYNAMMNHSTGGIDVPINPPKLINPDANPSQENNGYIVHIVQHWEPHPDTTSSLTIDVYSNAPHVELFVNGKSQGVQDVSWQRWAEWTGISYEKGNLTAAAMDDKKTVMATHTVLTNSDKPSKVVAYLDVPSTDTGTGSALVLDGQDAGMVSAAILDSNGRVMHWSTDNVTFSIVSGPGRIVGVGNGNPQCHEPNQASWRSAYHGLARVIVQVTEDHSTPSSHRQRLIQIDRDGSKRTYIQDPLQPVEAPDAIVVQASVEGVGSSTVTIPVTTDGTTHNVLSVAKATIRH